MSDQKNIAKKIVIVYVLNVLRHTNREFPVLQSRICEYLNDIGIPCDRKTVGRNVAYLQAMGYPIHRVPRKGYYLDAEALARSPKPFVE